ncbi:MAG: hypothetical protein ACYCPP_02175 [Nitrososphaerales archaeon]
MVAVILPYFLITIDVPGAADLADELGQRLQLVHPLSRARAR